MTQQIKTRFIRNIRALAMALPVLLSTALAAAEEPDPDQARFRELLDFARLANVAYLDRASIDETVRQQGYTLTDLGQAPGYEVSYYIATNEATKSQVIAVRGTANVENALVDVAFQLLPDEATGINLHQGFANSARAIYEKIRPQLDQRLRISTTGHSLGGADALVLAFYLDADGYNVDRVVTFGQPKVTNTGGSRKFAHLNVTRVVTPKDMVPLVPPLDPMDLKNLSIYWHLGTEIILLDGARYAEIDGLDSMMRATGFLNETPGEHNLKHHMMSQYLQLIEQKQQHPERVAWKNGFSIFSWGSKQ